MNKQASFTKLKNTMDRWTKDLNVLETPIPGLKMQRYLSPTKPASYILTPHICLISQGVKRVMLGEDAYVYDSERFLISSVGLPLIAQILEASKKKPYLGLTYELDLNLLSQLISDNDFPTPSEKKTCRVMAVSKVTSPIVNAFGRLLKLLDTPEDIPILAPLIKKEIHYRLLAGDQRPRLHQIVSEGSHGHGIQIAKTIDWLREHFKQTFKISDLADLSGMSPSSFHHHFRLMTAMTPLQFQKRLKLNEARRLMLTENFDATNAAFQVGYESPSQFSREYARLFGAPPLRDIKNLKQNTNRENF